MVCIVLFINRGLWYAVISLGKEFSLVEDISPIPIGIYMGLMDFESLIYR